MTTKVMSEEKQRQFDLKYLRMAQIWSENSYAERRKVGCLIVKDNMIISDGYNGTPSGMDNVCETTECLHPNGYKMFCPKSNIFDADKMNPHMCGCCEYGKLTTKAEVLHAESNAITKLAKSGNSSEGATLYVTLSPCMECAKLIIQSGIKRVVYGEEYRITDGLDLLRKANVEVVHLNIENKNDGE